MARKQIPSVIKCPTPADLQRELASIQDDLALTESEETWDTITTSILRLMALSKGSSAEFPREIVEAVRGLARPLNSAINSERTRLSGVAIELMTSLTHELQRSFEPLLPLFLPTLLTMCTRSNKVFVTRAKASIVAIVEHTTSPSMLSYFSESITDKSASLRLAAAECTLACLNTFNPPDLEKEPRAREVETIIRKAAVDANADIRRVGRRLFDAYKILLPGRLEAFVDPMTPTTKKYLDIKQLSTLNNGSIQTLKAKVPLSSSTSSLNPATKSHSGPHLTTHVRSMSEATMAGASRVRRDGANPTQSEKTGASGSLTSTSHSTTEMPPPKHAPTRPMRTMVAPQAPLRNAGRQPDIAMKSVTSTSHIAPISQTSDAQRPRSNTMSNAKVTSASRPLLNVSQSGPIRPKSSADMYQPLGAVERKERVVGGPRRVPRPPTEPNMPSTAADAEKTSSRDIAHSTSDSHSLVSVTSKLVAPTRTAPQAQRQRVTKGNEKVVPVVPPVASQSRDATQLNTTRQEFDSGMQQHTVNSAKTNAKSEFQTNAKPKVSKSRSNTSTTQTSRKVSTKPSSDRLASSKPSALSKTSVRSGKNSNGHTSVAPQSQESQPKAEIQAQGPPIQDSANNEMVVPILIPLPPSPVLEADEGEDRTDVPLERSNPLEIEDKGRKGYGREPVTPKHLTVGKRLDSVDQTPISALVADIQRDFWLDRSTPTPSFSSYVPLWDVSNEVRGDSQTAPLKITSKESMGRMHEESSSTS